MAGREVQYGKCEFKGHRFWYRSGTADEVTLSEQYQRKRFTVPDWEADAAPVIVDVGAHIGCFTVQAAARLPRATVYALEPAKQNFDLLSRNIEENALGNVVALPVALWDKSGPVALYHAAENWGHSLYPDLAGQDKEPESAGSKSAGADESEVVSAMSLREFMDDNRISTIDYLKMNAEGCEYGVFLNCDDETLAAIRCMDVEFHPFVSADGSQLERRLSQCGFDVRTRRSASGSGKGWIRADRRGRAPR